MAIAVVVGIAVAVYVVAADDNVVAAEDDVVVAAVGDLLPVLLSSDADTDSAVATICTNESHLIPHR